MGFSRQEYWSELPLPSLKRCDLVFSKSSYKSDPCFVLKNIVKLTSKEKKKTRGKDWEEIFQNIKKEEGTSLVVQWLRTHASTTGSQSSIPGWGTKILHAAWVTKKFFLKITILKL